MEIRIDGKVLLVTGGTQGVGRAIARGGGAVGRGGPDADRARRGTRRARWRRRSRRPACRRPSSRPTWPTRRRRSGWWRRRSARFGRVDGLASAAALTDRGTVLESDAGLLRPDVRGQHPRADAADAGADPAPARARGAPGAIVNILSVNVHGGTPELAVYAASKAATALLTRNAAFTPPPRPDPGERHQPRLGRHRRRARHAGARRSARARAGWRRRRRGCPGAG